MVKNGEEWWLMVINGEEWWLIVINGEELLISEKLISD